MGAGKNRPADRGDVSTTDNPLLRLGRVPHCSQLTPQSDVPRELGKLATPKSTKLYSAIAYWFGDKLQKELGVPVGILADNFLFTAARGFKHGCPRVEGLRRGPWPQDKRNDLALAKAEYDRLCAEKQPEMDRYLAAKAAARKWKPARRPPMFAGWPGEFRGPSGALEWRGGTAPAVPDSGRGDI